jgi:hypothetical protein
MNDVTENCRQTWRMTRSSREMRLSGGNVETAATSTKAVKHLRDALFATTREATSKLGAKTTEAAPLSGNKRLASKTKKVVVAGTPANSLRGSEI